MKEKIKKILKKIACFAAILVVGVCTIAVLDEKPTYADSGFSTSHSSSHSSSHRSSHSSSSSRRSSSSSRSTSRSSSSSSSGSGSSISVSGPGELIAVIIALLVMFSPFIIVLIVAILGSRSSARKTTMNYSSTYSKPKEVPAEKLNKILPDFDSKKFIQDGFELYKKVQIGWMNFDIESVRNCITDEMFNMYKSQLETLKVKNEQNIMKDMVMKEGYISDVSNQNGVVTLTTRYVIEQYDYIADKSTGKLIRGENRRKMRVDYEMKFRLSVDESKIIKRCPSCGADIESHNGAGVCEYCGSKIVGENKNWVLTEKNVKRQDYI